MIQITREQAENLISRSKVLHSRIERQASELKVVMTLSDQRSFLVCYNTKNHQKLYYIDRIKTPDSFNGH